MPATNLQRTMGTATNAKKGTLSFWTKLAKSNNSSEYMRFLHIGGTSNDFGFYIIGDTLRWYVDAGNTGYGDAGGRVLRDYSAYYHIVVAIDSTLATAADRIKCWVNGELQSSTQFPQGLNITQNADVFDSSHVYSIGATDSSNLAQAFAGILAHYHFIDGTAYVASDFGETDSTTGQWKPKTSPSVTYGTNGFFLKFANSGSMGTDSSGNGNNFTVSGNLTQTQDTPSNVFATLNTASEHNGSTFSNGNLTYTGVTTTIHNSIGSIGVTQGKWYFEAKRDAGASAYPFVGAFKTEGNMGNYLGNTVDGWAMLLDGTDNGEWRNNNTLSGTSAGTFINGSIAMVAIDMDNGKIWFGKDGTWAASGDPSAGTGEQYSNLTGTIIPAVSVYTGASISLNFGNGYFGTNAVSSANSDDAGYGLFEYAPPTGYYSLCTKNINTYG